MTENSLLKQNELIYSSLASDDRTNGKELVSKFISNILKEEKEEYDKKIVGKFIGSLFEITSTNKKIKKINNNKSKKNYLLKKDSPTNKKIKSNLNNNNNNNINNNNKINGINDKNNNQDKTIDNNIYRNSLIKKILKINEHKHNYERNKSIDIRPKNIIDEKNIMKKTNIKNNSAKKELLKN